MHRHHLAEGAAGEARPGDIDEIEAAGLRLELRLRPYPAQDLLRIGQEGEHRGRRRRDVRLAADDEGFLHRVSSLAAVPRRQGRFDVLPAAAPRLGRRMALTVPLLEPPQKN